MSAQTLRPYQARSRADVLAAWRDGARSTLLVIPTGGGKTSVFSFLTGQVSVPVLILVHRRELATQAANRLRDFSVDFGFILAGERRRPQARVQIASVQTLSRRELPPAKLVIADEAHLSTAATWAKILAGYPNARILGCTATPWRLSGKPLAGQYDSVIVGAKPAELREAGYLCDYSGFSYLAPDLTDVKTTAGDYNEKQSAVASMKPAIVANIVEKWKAHASDLSTIVFAVTVQHSLQLTAEFRAAGVAAEHLDGTTPTESRRRILARVESGETRVLCNVGVLIEGLDIPRLKCCVLARPTKSLARYLQMAGRVRRPWAECLRCRHALAPKPETRGCPKCDGPIVIHKARIHDHAFLIRQHGLPDDDRDYTLTAKPEKPPALTVCGSCFATFHGRSCPSCGVTSESEPVGERILNTIGGDEAEMFEFSSATMVDVPEPKTPESQPPVEVRWLPPDIGRTWEGVYLRSETDLRPVAWGAPDAQGWRHGTQRKIYYVRSDRRIYALNGAAMLDARMRAVKPGELIRVTYHGEMALGGARWKKTFTVQADR